MKKLFDFSAGMVFCALVSFGVLLSFFAFQHKQGGGVHFGILFLVTAAAFILLVIHFVFRAAELREDGVYYRGLFIPRDDLRVVTRYDDRFHESVYLLRDKNINYASLSDKEAAAGQIRLEATRGTRKKLEAYTGLSLEPEGKPVRRRKSRFFR